MRRRRALLPARPDTLVVAISATGGSVETLAAVEPYDNVVALTNTVDSVLARRAEVVVPMLAVPERSGVTCRTFQHTLAGLLHLETVLTGRPLDVPALCERTPRRPPNLPDEPPDWLPAALSTLDGPTACTPSPRQCGCPARSSRRSWCVSRHAASADACETGDWSHVDVYLSTTRDYRAPLLPGSCWDAPALDWLRERRSRILAVGADVPDAAYSSRYRHDDDADVRLLTETLVAELLAASSANAATASSATSTSRTLPARDWGWWLWVGLAAPRWPQTEQCR